MLFQLTPRLMTLDDLEQLLLSNSVGISRDFEDLGPTTAKRMKIDPYRQRRNCSDANLLFSGV